MTTAAGVVQVSRTASGGYTANTITYIETATGADQTHTFYVDLDTGKYERRSVRDNHCAGGLQRYRPNKLPLRKWEVYLL